MMSKKIILAGLLWAMFVVASVKPAQAQAFGTGRGETPTLEIGANYDFFHANAPPGACGCFSMSGAGGTLVFNAPHGVSVVADLSGGHASGVDGTSQNISLFNYVFGPRYSYRHAHRFTPYVEGLVGRSMEISNYAYVQQVSALGVMGGGGVSMPITRLIGWDVEADYVYSKLPNAVNNNQSTLRVSTGILFRFGPR
jgi:outer membrane immunogenic protein